MTRCQKYRNLAKKGRYASEEGNGEDMRHMLILVRKRDAITESDGVRRMSRNPWDRKSELMTGVAEGVALGVRVDFGGRD